MNSPLMIVLRGLLLVPCAVAGAFTASWVIQIVLDTVMSFYMITIFQYWHALLWGGITFALWKMSGVEDWALYKRLIG